MTALDPARGDLASTTLAWCDQWWDDDRGLPWAPDGHEAVRRSRSLHVVPGAAWYAYGLLARNASGDQERAEQVLHALCDLQYDRPGTDWHGTFAIFAESPTPPVERPEMWTDYDPNWRQFLGTTFLAILARYEDGLAADLVARLDGALRLAVTGELPHRVPASYSNIALMKAALEVGAGVRHNEPSWVSDGEDLARRVVAGFDRHGAFDEYNSPTYYGVDLFGLACWRSLAPSNHLQEEGARIEAALWRDTARWWHAGLGNMCAPYTRTYGIDLHDYVGKLCLWLWAGLGRDHAPLPALTPDAVHGHDFFAGAITAALGARIPADARPEFEGFTGERTVEQVISTPKPGSDQPPERIAAGWLAESVMIGAERSTTDLSWWDQYVAAAMHWQRPDGGIGWLTIRMPGPSGAAAIPGRLDVPRVGNGTEPAVLTVNVGDDDAAPPTADGTWRLAGLTVEVSGAGSITIDGASGASGEIVLQCDAPEGLTLTVG